MKIIGLVICLLLATGIMASANTTATVDIYSQWNLWSAPIVPIDPSPYTVLSNFDLMFDAIVMRLDATTQGYLTLDGFATSDPVFGGILLGDGYYTYNSVDNTITIPGLDDGVPDGAVQTDMWISLPGDQTDGKDAGGWHMIGCPFNHPVLVNDGSLNGARIQFTDGSSVKGWDDAVQAGWVSSIAYYLNSDGSQGALGYFFADDDHFRPGKGYFLQTLKDNLAMIIPGNTTD